MANGFMPSALTSLAGATGDTLQQALAEREFTRKLAEHQQQLQRQALMDQFSVAMRLQDQGQQERAFQHTQARDAERTRQAEHKTATAEREAENQRAARLMFSQAVGAGGKATDPSLINTALAGKVPTSMMPKAPKVEKTLDERIAERTALRTADKQVDAKFKAPKATKPAADDVKAPPALMQQIEQVKGTKGWATVDEASRSIEANWPRWRQQYGNTLDLNAVKRKLVNIYGTRPKGENSILSKLDEIDAELKSGKP